MRQGKANNQTRRPQPARAFALAAVLALFAIVGTASGLWSVTHAAIDHHHPPDSACHDGDAHHSPTSDDAPTDTDHDCPTCDLIAGSQTLNLTRHTSADHRLTELVGPTIATPQTHPLRQADLTAWSARPPPHVG
ncbi:hypothetical protein ACERK3_01985 [Phycisphaerales bacterium AB-hyl4]|uniref:DUF2946 domain-containing protein n=1 Tax=Natronomicrosphaera hydrolytica TaxID=3242702 RepID=A0ABV4U1L0_9BACT